MDGQQTLFTGPAGLVGQAFATNHDGSLVVGAGVPPATSGQSAWGWTQSGTACVCSPVQSRHRGRWTVRAPRRPSDDGRVIGGALSFGLESEAILWLDRQPISLRDYLRAHGVPDAFEGWFNTGTVEDVSSDGRVLVGFGAGPRDFKGYMVVLPPAGQ